MQLLANAIGFTEPADQFVVQIAARANLHVMPIGVWRVSDDCSDSRVIQPARENETGIEEALANDDAGETHPLLKSDA